MEGNGLFNPGFVGSGFHWWIGQIVDDSTWRENINPEKFEKVTDIPAWGYRYKVKIMGYHDQSEAAIKAEQLPWAHCWWWSRWIIYDSCIKARDVCFWFLS